MNPDDLLRLQYLKETGQHDEAAKYEQYLHETGHPQAPARPKIGQMGIPISDDTPEEPSYAQKALGGISALVKDLPGGEAAQAGARSFFRKEPYTDALSDIRSAYDAAPKVVRRANRVIGGVVGAAATPGANVVAQGAKYGAASGLLSADPMSAGERVMNGAKEAVIGAASGRLAQGLGTGARTVAARTLDRVSQLRRAVMEAADRTNYGKAAAEGALAAANPTPQVVNDVMDETDIKPYIAEIRASRTMQGAGPAKILHEAYKLMTERQRMLNSRIVNSSDFKAGSELEKADIGAAKKRVLTATDAITPSFRPAVYQHADRMREVQAFRAGADVARRVIKPTSLAAKNAEKNSPDAFLQSVEQMTPGEAKAAIQGMLGRLKERTGLNLHPTQGFGIPKSATRFSQIAPYLEALDRRAGNKTSTLLGLTGIAGGEAASH